MEAKQELNFGRLEYVEGGIDVGELVVKQSTHATSSR
jgi:hypothetical protein|tara:strand:- start:409 stop:519 length:111 start_codon:yes stop_codon:yes gene_type:complete